MSQTVTPSLTNWDLYRKCSQICRAEIGEPCVSRSGKVIDGQPDGVLTALPVPHKARKRRSGGRKRLS